MSEWTIQVETPAETTREEEAFSAFERSLAASEIARDAAALHDLRAGSLSATFQVAAPNEQEAAMLGCLAYWRALGDAGIDPTAQSRVLVSRGAPDDSAQETQPARGFRVVVDAE